MVLESQTGGFVMCDGRNTRASRKLRTRGRDGAVVAHETNQIGGTADKPHIPVPAGETEDQIAKLLDYAEKHPKLVKLLEMLLSD